MTSLVGTIVAAALVPAVLTLSTASASAARKCFNGNDSIAYVLDGKVVTGEQRLGRTLLDGRDISPEELKSVSVSCARESHRVFGVEPGTDLIVIWTKAAPPPGLKAGVEVIATLQEAYFARHGKYAAKLADLRWSEPAGLIAVRLCVSEDGKSWNALGWRSTPGSILPRVLVTREKTSDPDVQPQVRYSCEVRSPTPRATPAAPRSRPPPSLNGFGSQV